MSAQKKADVRALLGALLSGKRLRLRRYLMPLVLLCGSGCQGFAPWGAPGIEMVQIPAGSFMMGSPLNEAGRICEEGPQHRVAVAAFELGRYEVTQSQWWAVMAENPSKFRDCGANCPVESVNWIDIQEFIRRLNLLTGKDYRLPTEAEWEYAARAGNTGPFSVEGVISDQKANYDSRKSYEGSPTTFMRRDAPIPVGSFAPNAFGVHDVHGNVTEWVEDCWHKDYTGAPDDGSAWTRDCHKKSWRTLRGGSWTTHPKFLRLAGRIKSDWINAYENVGFRLARSLPHAPEALVQSRPDDTADKVAQGLGASSDSGLSKHGGCGRMHGMFEFE